MAIQSMTGFGRGESLNDNFSFNIDIKSVNHRFRDVRFKMPSLFISLELEFKKLLQDKFKRGSFDIYINFKRSEDGAKSLNIDEEKIGLFLKRMNALSQKHKVEMEFSPSEFLRQEFYKEKKDEENDELFSLAREAFNKALSRLEESRIGEGEKLVELLFLHREEYRKYYKIILLELPRFQTHVEEKLRKKFLDFQAELKIDEPRFLQEVVFYLEKLDVSEEVNRIKIHLEKLESLMSEDNEVGRQIDFLMQELGRETNTIGSKSSLKDISESVVQMKIQLEKIREQGLNLE